MLNSEIKKYCAVLIVLLIINNSDLLYRKSEKNRKLVYSFRIVIHFKSEKMYIIYKFMKINNKAELAVCCCCCFMDLQIFTVE